MPQNSNLPTTFNSSSLTRDPFRSLRTMQQQMDRLFDSMLGGGSLGFESDFLPASSMGQTFAPTFDVDETEEQYLLNFDLPGVKKEDIKVDLRNNVLTVSGERKEQREEKKKKSFQSERFYGTYQRSFTLPSSVKPEQIEANYSDGVLCIAVPKTEEMKPRQIKIGEGKPITGQKGISQKEESKAQPH